MDSEKGNMVFALGAQCAPPPPPSWFFEHKKSLVGARVKAYYTYDSPSAFPVDGTFLLHGKPAGVHL